jgi:hypothetical protein
VDLKSELNLQRNSIKEIDEDAFAGLDNLPVLSLDFNNKLKFIQKLFSP